MKIHAIADPHLSFGTPNKGMDKFGEQWIDHHEKITAACAERVADDDILLLPGDISWALRLPEAAPDLDWVAALPGTKIICRGNHDFWWQGIGRVRTALPDGVHALHADALAMPSPAGPVHFCGTRLWDVPGLAFGHLIAWSGDGDAISSAAQSEEEQRKAQKVYTRELGRVRAAMTAMDKLPGDSPALRIVLVHYPPTSAELEDTELTELFEAAKIDHVVFGHLHSLKTDLGPLFGEKADVRYHLTSCDYLNFAPIEIAELEAK